MPLHLIRADITKLECDAIVNAANSSLLGGGGVDGAIHRAAGPELLKECRTLGGCKVGDAKLTLAYELPAKFVIHTVGPIWRGGEFHEGSLLYRCYQRSLEIATEHNCESIAFPLISSGAYGYPKDRALEVAMKSITSFLETHELDVYLVIFDAESFRISESKYSQIQSYIDEHYIPEDFYNQQVSRLSLEMKAAFFDKEGAKILEMPVKKLEEDFEDESEEEFEEDFEEDFEELGSAEAASLFELSCPKEKQKKDVFLEDLELHLKIIDESFSQMVLRKIDESGLSDVECYKRANVDRKLFSKLRSNVHYKPSKTTAIAFAIALKLNLQETSELLMKAGYALSKSNKFDIIIEYFIKKMNYDIFEINEALFAFDQVLLGA